MSSYLPLSWSDRCLEPPYIWVRCGKREPRPGSGKGSCFWRLVLSASGGKRTTEGKISVLTAFSPSCAYTLNSCYHKHLYDWAFQIQTASNHTVFDNMNWGGKSRSLAWKKTLLSQGYDIIRKWWPAWAGGACVTWHRESQSYIASSFNQLPDCSEQLCGEKEAGRGDKTLCQNSQTDHLVWVTEGENTVHIFHCFFTWYFVGGPQGMNTNHFHKIWG